MDEIPDEAVNEPIATSTRVQPRDLESDDGSDDEDEYPPTMTVTRVS